MSEWQPIDIRSKANIHLINAASDLLEVCEAVAEALDRKVKGYGLETTVAEANGLDDLLNWVEEVIAKAKGKK